MCARGTGGRARGSAATVRPAAYGHPGNTGGSVLPWKAPVNGQRRRPSPAPRSPAPARSSRLSPSAARRQTSLLLGVAEGFWGIWKHQLPASTQYLRVYLALLLLEGDPALIEHLLFARYRAGPFGGLLSLCGVDGGLSSAEVQAVAEGRSPALGGSARAAHSEPVRSGGGDGEGEAGEDEADLLDTSDPPGRGESTASLEDLEDDGTHSGAEGGSGGAQRRGSGGGSVSKTCPYEGHSQTPSQTPSQVAKQHKPWMCKKHCNKMYKDKYKKKKSDQALNCGGAARPGSAGTVKLEESADNILSTVRQRTGSFGDRPARPTLLEQVLNQKRRSLLRSPEVVQFSQKRQQLLNQQVWEQRQQQFPGTSV
ncbi:regulatory factor X-associated protein-like [Mesoplodon densirostris]|uniref:regulatory factor X-associated protein-like n=1 Tax=Mesoplodon densirostris TaxID=48708 RepID=UPI0028DB9761|nr:regulatory factor X-associated protein-like [Mesoplodon densirostris]